MKNSTRCIATSCDSGYFPALAAFLKSTRLTNPHIPIVVFDGGLTPRQAKKVKKIARVIRKEPFMELAGEGKFSYIGNTTLLKLEVSSLEYDKVLYIDVDAVVLENLDEVFSFPEGKVAVVKEVNSVRNMFRLKHRQMLTESIDIDWDSPGFNAGVFALRPSEWRDLKKKARHLVDKFGSRIFSKSKDQQLLNIIFHGKTHDLPGRYNFSPLYDSGRYEPAIIHYLTRYKPWRLDYPEGYYYREFRKSISIFDHPAIAFIDASRILKGIKKKVMKLFPQKDYREEEYAHKIDPKLTGENKPVCQDAANVHEAA